MKFYFLALATLLALCVGCVAPTTGRGTGGHREPAAQTDQYYAPPAAMMNHPGPGVLGPGPGVLQGLTPEPPRSFSTKTTQIRFVGPDGMQIGWMVNGRFLDDQLVSPASYDFQQSATYQLKLSHIPGRVGEIYYPTLQIHPSHPTTDAYLAHNPVPVRLTVDDLEQLRTNNFVTKVVFLPDPEHQDLAIADVEELVSTRLEAGVDPVQEADRRGTVMAVLRVGNRDLEMPGQNFPGALSQNQTGPSNGNVQQVGFQSDVPQHMPPTPIGTMAGQFNGIPQPMIVANSGMPGMPSQHPISGMGNIPVWGQPMTGSPIGLVGPPHLPLGGRASLKSHTMVNNTRVDIGKPVKHFVVNSRHTPGYRMPHPVSYVEIEENHPQFERGEVSYPGSFPH
ncbi:MAG: hypothetical protein O3A00_20495 [Planctomycetota bacterium]|nr:hypothetical protein [Planctomycetota bacterium]